MELVVIGSTNYAGFTRNSTYTFYREKIFLLGVQCENDQEAYLEYAFITRIQYKSIQRCGTYSGWNLQANKTLYVNIPEGTSLFDAQTMQIRLLTVSSCW